MNNVHPIFQGVVGAVSGQGLTALEDATVGELLTATAHKSTAVGRLGAKAKIDAELGNEYVWHATVADVTAVVAQHKALHDALKELVELCEWGATFETKDIEQYKFDAIVDDTLINAAKALKLAGAL